MKTNVYHFILTGLLLSGCVHPNHQDDHSNVVNNAPSVSVTSTRIVVPAPVLREAISGKLYLGTLGSEATVEVTYTGIQNGDTVGLRWTGSTVYNAHVQTVGAIRPLVFTVPKTTITLDKGRSAVLTSSVGVGDNPLVISAPLTVEVVDGAPPGTSPSGAKIAQDLNTRYRDTQKTCSGNLPAYYCDGVIIRSTENGNFDPWNPSPAAIALGGVSFSYMRLDAHVDSLYHNSGFTFLPQAEAIKQGKNVDYLCIYAYDAGTLVGVRGAQGCGLKPRASPTADISTCSGVGVRTAAQWYTYTATISNRDYQCSLSTQDPDQFAVSVQVRANRPPNMDALWNEMMVKLWSQNIPTQLPLEAFFYKSTGGLAEAKSYQTKYKTRTGGWLPVIKLDLTKLTTTPFSYSQADQAVPQP